jgi:hypothetical protein
VTAARHRDDAFVTTRRGQSDHPAPEIILPGFVHLDRHQIAGLQLLEPFVDEQVVVDFGRKRREAGGAALVAAITEDPRCLRAESVSAIGRSGLNQCEKRGLLDRFGG